MQKRIVCKTHDKNKVITHVGVQGEMVYPIINVWNDINLRRHIFFTNENGKIAKVYANIRNDKKYLTSDPDGVSENNLDELKKCVN
jgi:hypothetical protein